MIKIETYNERENQNCRRQLQVKLLTNAVVDDGECCQHKHKLRFQNINLSMINEKKRKTIALKIAKQAQRERKENLSDPSFEEEERKVWEDVEILWNFEL